MVGRRTLLLYGHVGIAICHFMIGFFNMRNDSTGVLLMMLTFLIVY